MITGLNPEQVRTIADRTRLRGHYACLASKWVTDLVFGRLLAAYLLAGFPVILFVDINRLHRDRNQLHRWYGCPQLPQGPQSDHAVVAVGGCNLDDPDPAAATIVLHDTAIEPYVERPISEVAAACRAFGKESKVGFVAYCPRPVKVGALRVLEEAIRAGQIDPGSDPLWRIRWSETALLGARYFGHRKRWWPLQDDTADPGAHLQQGIKSSSVWLLELFGSPLEQRTKRPHRVVGFDAERLASGPLFVLGYNAEYSTATVHKQGEVEARKWLALTGELESW